MVIKALNCGYSSFTGWNLMLDESGGPNVGPFFCGGFVTRNSMSGDLSYSGQYKAFAHFSNITPESRIYPLSFNHGGMQMFSFNINGSAECKRIAGCLVENTGGHTELILVNPSNTKEQVQYRYGDKWWYIEMLPNTVATVIFT